MEFEPNNEKIYFNLGMLSMDDGKHNDAENFFIKAIKVYFNCKCKVTKIHMSSRVGIFSLMKLQRKVNLKNPYVFS